ncbi:MAG: LysR family transcriptional regulator [Elainellaceae cyanobacterium]
MNRFELSQLEMSALIAFIEVAERGSFTDAAASLHLSQPTISQQVQRLERFVGVKLLHRKSGKVSLTEAGETFIHHARDSLRTIVDGMKAVSQISQIVTGSITLGLTPSAAHRCLSSLLPQYCTQYPGVAVRIIEDYPNELIEGLEQRTIDLAVLSLPVPLKTFNVDVLYEEPLVLVAAATHPLAAIDNITWGDLSHQSIVLPRQRVDFGIRYIIEELYCTHHHSIKAVAEVSGFQSLRQLVLSNFGITFLPLSQVQHDVSDGKLVIRKLPGQPLTHKVALVTCRQHSLSVAAEKLADAIQAHAYQTMSSQIDF